MNEWKKGMKIESLFSKSTSWRECESNEQRIVNAKQRREISKFVPSLLSLLFLLKRGKRKYKEVEKICKILILFPPYLLAFDRKHEKNRLASIRLKRLFPHWLCCTLLLRLGNNDEQQKCCISKSGYEKNRRVTHLLYRPHFVVYYHRTWYVRKLKNIDPFWRVFRCSPLRQQIIRMRESKKERSWQVIRSFSKSDRNLFCGVVVRVRINNKNADSSLFSFPRATKKRTNSSLCVKLEQIVSFFWSISL